MKTTVAFPRRPSLYAGLAYTILVAFLALFVASCAEDTIWWELPPDMTDEERSAFGEGLELCNAIAIRQQFIAPDGDGTHHVFLRRPENMVNGPHTTGEMSRSFGVMNLVRGQPHKQLIAVVAHEGLHAAGMRAHHEARGIMNASGLRLETPEDPVAFTEADREACRRESACR